MNTLKILVFADLMEEMVVAEAPPEFANVLTVAMNHLKHAVSPVEIKNAQNVIHHYVEQNSFYFTYFYEPVPHKL
jgi:hypothetical protein